MFFLQYISQLIIPRHAKQIKRYLQCRECCMNFLVPKSIQYCAPPESVIKSLFVTIQMKPPPRCLLVIDCWKNES